MVLIVLVIKCVLLGSPFASQIVVMVFEKEFAVMFKPLLAEIVHAELATKSPSSVLDQSSL
jgi:hypothetical protein